MIMRKTKHWLVTAVLLLCSIVVNAHDFVVSGIYYKITSRLDFTVAVTYQGSYASYSNEYSGKIVIPATVVYNGATYKVTSIGNSAFEGCSSLTSVTISDKIEKIGYSIFSGCTSLKTIVVAEGNLVYDSRENCNAIIETSSNTLLTGCSATTIPSTVKRLGMYAFQGCKGLASLSLPEGLMDIGDYAFMNCADLTSITIPESVEYIGRYAFEGCDKLLSIYIPKGVRSMGERPIEVSNLISIVVSEDNPVYDSREGCNAIIETSSNTLLVGCSTSFIPNTVTCIGNEAFYCCNNLKSITMPEGMTSIGNNAFSGCSSLVSFAIPSSVTYIGNGAFSCCTNLTSINIPEGITEIRNYTFEACEKLTSISIPYGVTSIGYCAFYYCALLSNITIPESVTSVAGGAFYGTKSWNSLSSGAFYVGKWLCDYKGTPSSVKVKDGTIGIADRAFYGQSNLSSITIPEGVKSIGKEAFYNCSKLTSITIPKGLVEIRDYAFNGCANLTSVNLPAGLAGLGEYSFGYCTNLASINIPEGVTTIGERAFFNCGNLTAINMPKSITSIGNGAFHSTGLYNNHGDGVIYIGDWLYYYKGTMPQNTSILVRDNTIGIAEYAFGGNSNLVSINIPQSVKYIGESAFTNCTGLSSVVIPEDITHIEDWTFFNCSSLTSVRIPSKVASIGNYAFRDCSSLLSITCEATTPPVCGNNYTFNGINKDIPIYVPRKSVSAYRTAEYWSDFTDYQSLAVDEVLTDGEDFSQPEPEECDNIFYTRTFNNTNWQALYVPFEIPYENIKDDFEVAYINDTRQYDRDDDGVKEETVIEAFKITSGTLEANYPYLIRAKEAGEKTITVTDAMLYATEENSIDCSSVYDKYTFTGTYSRMSSTELTGCYALSGGVWQPIAEGATLGAFRFYLQVESRSAQAAQSIKMRVIGEETDDEATSIDEVESEDNEQIVYDLAGRRVANPTKGVYIVNGKKVLYN